MSKKCLFICRFLLKMFSTKKMSFIASKRLLKRFKSTQVLLNAIKHVRGPQNFHHSSIQYKQKEAPQKEFYIQYNHKSPVLIETLLNGDQVRKRPLLTVAHLIAAFQKLYKSPLSAFAGDITLHLPVNVVKNVLSEYCYATALKYDTTLNGSCPLSLLSFEITNSKKPLILKSKVNYEKSNYQFNLMQHGTVF